MTSQCKSVLLGLKKLTQNTECDFAYLHNSTCFCLVTDYSKVYDYKKYENEIDGITTLLVQEGYLIPTYDKYTFKLTQKGLHNRQFTLRKITAYFSDKFIDFLAVIISIFALLNSYGYDLLTPLINLCKKLLRL